MPDRLELTKNVLFFKCDSPNTDQEIEKILELATENKESNTNFVIDQFRAKNKTNRGVDYTVSIKVFPTVRPVYFLDDDTFEDRIYAYILVIEINDYLVILSKSCSTFLAYVKENFKLIEVAELSRLVGDNAEFQKIALRNMTVSEKAVRNRSYEGNDIRSSFSSHSAGRSIPSHLKIKEKGQIKSISSTGRIVESSPRQSIEEITDWAYSQIQLINTSKENNFLKKFAKKVSLGDVLSKCNPSALLIDISAIEDKIEDGTILLKYELFKKEKINGKIKKTKKYIEPSIRIYKKLFDQLGRVYELNQNLRVINLESTSYVNKNKRTLSISSKLLRKFKVEENSKIESLLNYINKQGLFCLTFDDPRFMYCMDNCFEDVSGTSEIESILAMLHPQKDIEKIQSEKGTFKAGQKHFSKGSMFHFVEKLHSKDDYIFCDDLGDEWADHLVINSKEYSISFIHSKYSKDVTNSASQLQDVVGQGIKNLGNMHFTSKQIVFKNSNSLAGFYKSGKGANGEGTGVQTNISRIRKSSGNIENDINLILKNPKLHRKCILACNFISKSYIEAEFNKIKQGQKVRGNITQWLWILSSFSHAAKDAGVFPMIYCAA